MTSNVVKILDISGVTNKINLDLFCPCIERKDKMVAYSKSVYDGCLRKERI